MDANVFHRYDEGTEKKKKKRKRKESEPRTTALRGIRLRKTK